MFTANLGFKGLYTYSSPLSPALPPGACSAAMNVNGDWVDMATSRRGFSFYSSQQFTITNGYITKLFVYLNTLYASYNGGQFAQDDGDGEWTTYGSGFLMEPPAGGALHQMLAGGNSYFTTSNGLYKLSGVNASAPVPAGSPAALDTVATPTGQISSGFLNAQSQCAYQIVWGYTDKSKLLILGTPSYPVVAQNTQISGGSNNCNVELVFSIPPQVERNQTLPWFYQVYRTVQTASLSVPPGNNAQLVAQNNPQSADLTNHYISFADTVLDSLLGAFLYTADGQPSVGQPYGEPPLALDATYFNGMAFYANFSTLQTVLLTLDAVGASSGIQAGDTITLTDSTTGTAYTYTGGGSNVPATRTFAVYTGGTPAVNIQTTAQNLVSVINQDPSNTLFTIQYLSSSSQLPGAMQVYAQGLGQAFFSIVSSRTTCWTPELPSSGATYASSSTAVHNGLQISNLNAPESCPPSQIEFVGSPNFPITRIIAVRTGLIVLKREEGVFLVTGTSPATLTITTLDTTSFVLGSETLAALNNSGYYFTTQGVMLANESGCQIMSRNVQGDVLTLASANYPNFQGLAFAIGYQSDNAYILFCQENPGDLWSTIQWRYNWITQAWTNWDVPCTAAIINTANDTLYLATPGGMILKERKSFTSQDFADESAPISIVYNGGAVTSPATMTLRDSSGVQVGDAIVQTVLGVTYSALVLSVNTSNGQIVVETNNGFQTGAAQDLAAIAQDLTFMPTACGYPGFVKRFTTYNFEFAQVNFTACQVSFTTDFYAYGEGATLIPSTANGWGTFPWGTVPWGVTGPAQLPIPVYATKNTALGHWTVVSLALRQVYAGFFLMGLTVFFQFAGERSR